MDLQKFSNSPPAASCSSSAAPGCPTRLRPLPSTGLSPGNNAGGSINPPGGHLYLPGGLILIRNVNLTWLLSFLFAALFSLREGAWILSSTEGDLFFHPVMGWNEHYDFVCSWLYCWHGPRGNEMLNVRGFEVQAFIILKWWQGSETQFESSQAAGRCSQLPETMEWACILLHVWRPGGKTTMGVNRYWPERKHLHSFLSFCLFFLKRRNPSNHYYYGLSYGNSHCVYVWVIYMHLAFINMYLKNTCWKAVKGLPP